MANVTKDLGLVTAYGYHKAGGGTLTEAEFEQKMVDITTAVDDAETAKDDAVAAKNAAEASAQSISQSAQQIATNTADITDLKEDLSDTEDWLGYPKNLFNARAFKITNTSNWSIDSVTKTAITITHKTTYSTGQPIAPLSLPSGDYVFHADYSQSAIKLSLKQGDTWFGELTDGVEFAIDDAIENKIYFSSSVVATYTITGISILPKTASGKISSLESVTQQLESTVAKHDADIEDLTTGFAQITDPVISSIDGTETQNQAISSTGSLVAGGTNNYRTIRYAVTVGKKYYIDASSNYGNRLWCFYDSNNNVVELGTRSETGSAFTDITDAEAIAPTNASYLVIGYHSQHTLGNVKTQTGLAVAKKWVGKKWVCVGDSLTAINDRTTKHYFDYVADATGITTVNMGDSGSGYAREQDVGTAFYQRIGDCPTDADVVTIFGSFNDLGAGLPIGAVDDTGTDTLAGCINTTITNLQTVIPLVNLGIVAPTPWDTTQPSTSGNAYNYVEMLKSICERRSIPFLDLWRCSNLRPWDADFRTIAYSKDGGSGTHPDENGHKLIAPRFEGFLKMLLLT